jgi:hypothetical protein
VPPYASIGSAAASVAVVERLGRHLGIDFDVDDLRNDEREQHAHYDAAVAADAMLKDTVRRLESVAGELDEEQLPTGDELAREIERFLRGQGEPGDG